MNMEKPEPKDPETTKEICSWSSFNWPAPFMKKEIFKKGDIIFRLGDKADKMFYIKTGALKLVEINKVVKEGQVIGEMGIFSPSKQRMSTAVCEDDLEVYTLGKEDVVELFKHDSTVALDLMHLSCERFMENLKRETEAKERIKSELRIAHEIQISMLPRIFPPFPGRKEFDIFATMVPAKEVGGDFYDFFFIDKNKLCFLVGDVSGKGVPASLFMAISKTLLKTEALHGLSPDEVLYRVNNTLFPDNDTCMFVTIFCMILDVETGRIQFANAGHNPPLICKDKENFEFLDLPKGCIAGVLENSKFESRELVLKPNDTLFLYTDGVTEAMNPKNELFSEERLKKALLNLKKHNIQNVVDIIYGVNQEIKLFTKGTFQSDDITMLVLKYNGPCVT